MTMVKRGFAGNKEDGNSAYWSTEADPAYFNQLKREDQTAVLQTQREVEEFSQQELIKYTYIKYPYWAIKSQIAKDILSSEQMEKVNQQKRKKEGQEFFTIGYEGVSLETYLNKLILNDVRLLCDVRKNSLSMKYGFSKNQLKNACESIGVKYMHIPQLGIDSGKRTDLKSIGDYNKLFDEYDKTTLVENREFLIKISQLTSKYHRVAITCFEKEACMCHRSRVAKSLKELPDWNVAQKNL